MTRPAADPKTVGVDNGTGRKHGVASDRAPLEGVGNVHPLDRERSETVGDSRSEARLPSFTELTPRCVSFRIDSASIRRLLSPSEFLQITGWIENSRFGSVSRDRGGWLRLAKPECIVSVGEHVTTEARTPYVYVRPTARGLWGVGYRAIVDAYISLLSDVIGSPCDLHTAYAHGWEVHRLELAGDFVSFPIRNEDPYLFVTKSKVRTTGSPVEEISFGFKYERRPGKTDPTRKRPSSGTTLKLEDKSGVCRRNPVSSPRPRYQPSWSANGASAIDPITRVEVGASGAALIKHGLADPAAALNLENLCSLWRAVTKANRLVVASGPTNKRKREIDPRWCQAQLLGFPAAASRIKTRPSEEDLKPLRARQRNRRWMRPLSIPDSLGSITGEDCYAGPIPIPKQPIGLRWSHPEGSSS